MQHLDEKIEQNVMGNLVKIERKGRADRFKTGRQIESNEGIKIGEQKGFREAIRRLLAHMVNSAEAARVNAKEAGEHFKGLKNSSYS